MRALRTGSVCCLAAGVALLWSGWAAAGVARSGWFVQPSPSAKRRSNSSLLGVSCASVNVCIAVGQSWSNASNKSGTLAERWDGRRWTIQHSLNPTQPEDSELLAVSCTSAGSCIAVGESFNSLNRTTAVTLAERWNGRKWTIQRTPNPRQPENGELHGISCASARACIAVGDSFNQDHEATLAERWNGRRWTIQPTPNLSDSMFSELRGVSCPSVTVCTAVGFSDAVGTLAERWNGGSWRIQPVPDVPYSSGSGGSSVSGLAAVSCRSVRVCTAAGGRESDDSSSDPSGQNLWTLAERWDGRKWTIQHTPSPSGVDELFALSCASASTCTAVGSSAGGTLAERWNGTKWTIQRTPSPTNGGELNGVWCASASKCTAVGDHFNTALNYRTWAERWNHR
jgi:hypothetical protein